MPFPRIQGADVAGRIAAVGSSLKHILPQDGVDAVCFGEVPSARFSLVAGSGHDAGKPLPCLQRYVATIAG